MKKLRVIGVIGIFFFLDYLFATQPNGLNPVVAITELSKYDSLGYSGADSAVYESLIQDRLLEKGEGK